MERSFRKTRVGTVVSDKMEKTVIVRIQRQIKHPIYGKAMWRSKKFQAHDEDNRCKIGDQVRIMETRPISKNKCWRVIEVISSVVE
ncbi:30S ribosomal protein S17 [bacterium]|nr:30S ribosomal protein S17 [bacterium]